ncbi:hypothetical protein C0J45_0678, partial [Silurus meridionalis]
SDIIRQIALGCGADHPEASSSTRLRKHMATISKVLNLKDNEMDDFLGHDIRVHRQYNRLPEGTLKLAKISKVLLAMERGQLSQFKGRNLDVILIDPQVKTGLRNYGKARGELICYESLLSQLLITFILLRIFTKPTEKVVTEEIQAVEKTQMDYISSGKVPGKGQCMQCKSPAALQGRGWKAVKFYVKNRIDSMKRKI